IQRSCTRPNASDETTSAIGVHALLETDVKSLATSRRSRYPRKPSSSQIGTTTTDPTVRNRAHAANEPGSALRNASLAAAASGCSAPSATHAIPTAAPADTGTHEKSGRIAVYWRRYA